MHNYQSTSHVYALSVNAASALIALGVPIRVQDGITRELDGETEVTRYWFDGPSPQFGKAADLLQAYSILAKGKFDNTKPTADEVITILRNDKHVIHSLHAILSSRDELHREAISVIKSACKDRNPLGIHLSDTAAAAAVKHFSNENPTLFYSDAKCLYAFQSQEAVSYTDAYQAAWKKYILDNEHPLYYAKAALENRSQLLKLKYQATVCMLEHPTALKTIITPMGLSDKDFNLAKQYL